MSQQRTWIRLVVAAVVLSMTALLYQNCSSSASFATKDIRFASSAESGGGNGHGYGGKPYVRRLATGTCPDGSAIDLRIVVTDESTGAALITRENCKVLTTPRKVVVSIVLAGATISYDGQTLLAEEPGVVAPTLAGTAAPSPSPSPGPTCAVNSGQACTMTSTQRTWGAGCPQDYVCASYTGVWYGSATGCDRSGESCSDQQWFDGTTYQSCTRPAFDRQHVGYVGARCTYIGNGTTDPFKGVADGQCHLSADYPIANTYTQMVPGTGCKERPIDETVTSPGTIGCDGICR